MKPISEKIVFSSKELNKNQEPYLVVKETTYKDGSKYLYSSRPQMNSIKFILKDKDMLGVVKEMTTPKRDVAGNRIYTNLSAFGGSLDGNKGLILTVMKEVKEETGYQVGASKINYVGVTPISTQTDELVYCFVVDVENLKPQARELEQGEKTSVVQWLTSDKFVEAMDAISLFTMIKYSKKMNHKY